ncbi:MAG: transposase [Desulforhopalus sp.]|nr:transposase [Desulforhopalus sp.]
MKNKHDVPLFPCPSISLHIRSALGLDRFTLRGKAKVNTQWNLFCIVHNLIKIFRYGVGFA